MVATYPGKWFDLLVGIFVVAYKQMPGAVIKGITLGLDRVGTVFIFPGLLVAVRQFPQWGIGSVIIGNVVEFRAALQYEGL